MAHGDRLVIATGSLGCVLDDGQVELDRKFADGAAQMGAAWGGPVTILAPSAPPGSMPFAVRSSREALAFDVVIGRPDEIAHAALADGVAAILAPTDSPQWIGLPQRARSAGIPCVVIAENTLANQLVIARQEDRPLRQRVGALLWVVRQERRRRATMRAASGLQTNGYPAWRGYARQNPNAMRYLDSRLSESDFPAAPQRQRTPGEPLQLMFSGRFERIKGVADLAPIMLALRQRGVDAELHLFGRGAEEEAMRAAASRDDLPMRFHGAVDFADELMPFARTQADLFVCPHTQSDPSCTYLETLSCALPIAGYANDAFAPLIEAGASGVAVPVGDTGALADAVAGLASDPARLDAMAAQALEFARPHSFEATVARRMAHVRAASVPSVQPVRRSRWRSRNQLA